jgi:GNAT superfamily N-acetyltransferase
MGNASNSFSRLAQAGQSLPGFAILLCMVQQHFFESQELPAIFKCQILSFMRAEWPEDFQGKNRLRNWIKRPEMHPVHFLLEEEDILISHVAVVWKRLSHAGQEYKAYGFTEVFTYPIWRRQGYGLQLIQAANEYIERQGDADLIIFHSTVRGFYEHLGFEPMNDMVTLIGDPHHPSRSNDIGFMRFLSEKGKKSRDQFARGTLYFGEDTW